MLRQEAESYRKEYELLGRRFMALYHALGSEAGCRLIMDVLDLKIGLFMSNTAPWPDGSARTCSRAAAAGASPPTAASAT